MPLLNLGAAVSKAFCPMRINDDAPGTRAIGLSVTT